MKETSKSLRRRWLEDSGIRPLDQTWTWKSLFVGKGIDVGAGDDPLPFPDCQPFDVEHGDANKLSNYFPEKTFDYLHASQCLEHMYDPYLAMLDWIKVVKLGGHIIVTVPEMSLYGDILWGDGGSRYNPDHKSTWSFGLPRSGAPIHIFVPDFIKALTKNAPVTGLLARVVDTNYNYKIGFTKDQTFHEYDGVEAWIEFLFKKL